MLTTEQINRITIEESLGKKSATKDTAEEWLFRQSVRKDIKKITDKGGEVQLPNE